MATFVLVTRMRPDAVHDGNRLRETGKDWLRRVHRDCPAVKFQAHYALLGRFDFLDLFEAPDLATANQVAAVTRAEGAVFAESWPAVPYERYLERLERESDGS